MFEHLPYDIRKKALSEFLRLLQADGTMILAVPCGKAAAFFENIINSACRVVKRRDHRWLKDHIAYGLPSADSLRLLMNEINPGLSIQEINNVNVVNWFLLYLVRSLTRGPLRSLCRPLVINLLRKINFVPYRKIFVVKKKDLLSDKLKQFHDRECVD